MRKISSALAAIALFVGIFSNANAAELLDVKPVATGNSVSVEISADIPMTYTYYAIPGQPRAVVDIADADPEKVEPLIVVNQGVISSISVDKAQIAGMVVSRIVFNLISEAEIAVAANADRKTLTVSFASASKSVVSAPQADAKPKVEHAAVGKHTNATTGKPLEMPQTEEPGINTEDPFGLDEETPILTREQPGGAKNIPVRTVVPVLPVTAAARKLEPLVPDDSNRSLISIKRIVVQDSYIDIQTSAAVGNYKVIKLSQPERIAIDIALAKNSLDTKTVLINKLGIGKMRIGVYPEYTRIVLDATKNDFPKHTITRSRDGLRINFN